MDKFSFSLVEYVAKTLRGTGLHAELFANDMLTIYEDERVPVLFLDQPYGERLMTQNFNGCRASKQYRNRSEESVKRSIRRLRQLERERAIYEANIIDALVEEMHETAEEKAAYEANLVDWLVEESYTL